MKFLALIAFVALGGFAFWENTKISDLNQEIQSLRAPKLTPASVSQAPTQRIICPLCHGERCVILRSSNKLQAQAPACPVCVGMGYRELKVLKGYKICPDCNGMGIAFHQEAPGVMPRHDNCGRCSSTGLVADIH